jgi:TPR repeat protein
MLDKIASLGNVAVQHQLGIFYQEDNETLALKWFSLAAEGGISDAYYRLGVLYQEGRGTNRNYSKAMESYENAAAKDHEEAIYRLAQMYLHGKGTKVDYEKAYLLYTTAAKQGHYLSRKFLNITNQPFSALYDKIEHDSPGVGSNSKNMDYSFPSTSDEFGYSMKMYKYIAEKGDAGVQYMLGLVFEDILSVPSYSEAFKWFTIAAGNSHPRAIYRLGLLYEKGLGVSQNYHEAAQLYEVSSDLEDPDAIYRYAKLLHYGKGVDVDWAKAVNYYTAAACRGNPEAQFSLAIIYEKGKLSQKNILEALKLFTSSYSQNHDGARLSLFQLYDHEPFEPFEHHFYKRLFCNMSNTVNFILDLKMTDYTQYIAFLDNEKTGSSMYTVGQLYLFGLGTQKNWLKALEYLTTATKEYGHPDTEYLIDSILSKHLSELSDSTDTHIQFYVGSYFFFLANQNKTVSHRDKFRSKCVDPAITQDGSSTFTYYRKAIDWFSPLASEGDREAQYHLGNMYSNGHGTEIDKQQAIAWYSEAAEHDHVDAQYELGMLYFTGVNSNIDYRLSLKFIKRAALSGHRKAIFHIGWMYKHGLGFTKSEKEAIEWFNISLPSRKIQFSYDFDLAALIGV